MPKETTKTAEKAAQEARARQLRACVKEVVEEAKQAAAPDTAENNSTDESVSPREFIHRKMAEARAKKNAKPPADE